MTRFVSQLNTLLRLLSLLLVMPLVVTAQDSASTINRDRLDTHTGIVTSFAVGERIVISVRDGDTTYQADGDLPEGPGRSDWTESSLYVGDRVTVVMHPSKNNPQVGALVSVTTALGIRLMARPLPRPDSQG